jgi:hypothetical protein
MSQKCYVINCCNPVVANNLCSTHDKRVKRHGDVNAGRSNDWGKREKHPAYRAWCGLRRYHLLDITESWKNDFWAFVADVPEKPENGKSFRPNNLIPWSKENFYWKESRSTSKDKKEYAREWHKKSRESNPEYYKDIDLRKNYGVSLEWYNEKLVKQNNCCAICNFPEKVKIKGKLLKLSVDHCHSNGNARGLLCTSCNRGLGFFKDSSDLLKAAIEYLSNLPSGSSHREN